MHVFNIISIHVLREEDDPRASAGKDAAVQFLSTSSARRTTDRVCVDVQAFRDFYPRPPRGGRRSPLWRIHIQAAISIHVLREEDDNGQYILTLKHQGISIHVLREEDDEKNIVSYCN